MENRNDWKPIDAWQVGSRWITVDYTPSSIKSVGQSPLEQLYISPALLSDKTFYIYIWTELRKPNILIDDVHLNRVESFDNVIQCQRNSSKTLSWRDSVIHQAHHHEIRCRKWTFRLILYKTLSTPVSKKKKSVWWVYFEILSIFTSNRPALNINWGIDKFRNSRSNAQRVTIFSVRPWTAVRTPSNTLKKNEITSIEINFFVFCVLFLCFVCCSTLS